MRSNTGGRGCFFDDDDFVERDDAISHFFQFDLVVFEKQRGVVVQGGAKTREDDGFQGVVDGQSGGGVDRDFQRLEKNRVVGRFVRRLVRVQHRFQHLQQAGVESVPVSVALHDVSICRRVRFNRHHVGVELGGTTEEGGFLHGEFEDGVAVGDDSRARELVDEHLVG